MSCGQDQWQQNAHGPNSLNYVTTRSNGQESLRSRAQSSMHVDLKRLPQNNFYWWTNFQERAVNLSILANGTEHALNHADPCEVERKKKSEASARRPRGWHPCKWALSIRAGPQENSQSSATNWQGPREGRQSPPEQSRANQDFAREGHGRDAEQEHAQEKHQQLSGTWQVTRGVACPSGHCHGGVQSSDCTSAGHVACETQRGRFISRHMERLAALRRRRRRLSRARRPAPAASAGWATAAAATLGGASPEGRRVPEAAANARETRERRSWAGGTGGQLLTAKPVTSPD